jgi:hypothetical protein
MAMAWQCIIHFAFRTMPFAIIVGMSTIALLYLSMNFSYFVVLSIAEMKKSDAVAMVNCN